MDWDDTTLFFSHETIHLILLDTVMSYLTLVLFQIQYFVIVEELAVKRRQIELPSLRESTGMMARAQAALDAVDAPMTLIHELMALSLVEFLNNQGLLLVCIELPRQLDKRLKETMPNYYYKFTKEDDYTDPARIDKLVLERTDPKLAGFYRQVHRSWIAYYGQQFHTEDANDFTMLYRRLEKAWHKIGQSIEGDDASTKRLVSLLIKLCRYPLDIRVPWYLTGTFSWFSWSSFADAIASRLIEVQDHPDDGPIAKLRRMLTLIEAARKLRGIAAWERYLSEVLPGFDEPLMSGCWMLTKVAEALWSKRQPRIALSFCTHFSHRYEAIWFMHLPVLFSEEINEETGVVLALESLRHHLLAGRGPVCLCTPNLRSRCALKELLHRVWESVIPAPGHENSFAEFWRQPECGFHT